MSSYLDWGPGTVEPDGPRSARGLWRLLQIRTIGAVKARRIAEAFPTWAALTDASPDTLRAVGVAGVTEELRSVPDIDLPGSVNGQVISIFDPGYPQGLRELTNAPVLVWVQGELPRAAGVAVVGTREPTAFGIRVAKRAAEEAVAVGLPVISGMARGIDQVAEAAAATAGGIVVSVLGSGLDDTPGKLAGHRDAILAAGGSVLTEQPPGTRPSGPTLVARDRIQIGLSRAVVIAQADLGSGTRQTVRFALINGCPLIVARPADDSEHHNVAASRLLLALTDPAGMDPALIGLTGRHAAAVSARRPAADVVAHTGEELAVAIRQAAAR